MQFSTVGIKPSDTRLVASVFIGTCNLQRQPDVRTDCLLTRSQFPHQLTKREREHLPIIDCRVLVMDSSEELVFRFIVASRYRNLHLLTVIAH